jgi:diaminopimelate epimerase
MNNPSSAGVPLRFWKLNGAGNTFVGLDNRRRDLPEGEPRADLVRALCDGVRGLATDGVLLIEPPTAAGQADVRMRYYNRDGSGNGARCLALFARFLGAAPERKIHIETQAGLQIAEVGDDNRVLLAMPDIPPPLPPVEIEAGSWRGALHRYRVGVPHAVTWVPRLEAFEALNVNTLGRALRYHDLFLPEGANVNFAFAVKRSGEAEKHLPDILIRTYERGVERETLACGTGSVATAVCATRLGLTSPPVALQVKSGDLLRIHFHPTPEGGAEKVVLEGPAEIFFQGKALWNPSNRTLTPPQG